MESESIMSFEASSSVEFEDMEMTELDADTLMKLLEEEPAAAAAGEEQGGGGGCVVQPAGWTGNESGGGSHKKEEEVVGNELEWLLDVTEMPPAPPCAEEVSGEMFGMGEYGLDYYYYYNNNNNNAAYLVEETVFEGGLWQNSY